MAMSAKILVVDDTAMNVKLIGDLLTSRGYTVCTAASGEEALAKVAAEKPDLVVLDIMMPGMSGYDVCRKLRADPETALLPIVLATSLDPNQERVKGIEAGADDFLSKPVNQPELFARVKSLLRIKTLQDEIKRWNSQLAARVEEQVAQLEGLGRLKGFFSSDLADAIVSGGAEAILKPHRREVTVVFLDLRGFTVFTESAEPEEVMELLREYHGMVGPIATAHRGTIERFAGDGMMIFFNDPIELPNAPEQAVRMALATHAAFSALQRVWKKRGYSLDLGIGIALGYATCGAIGFERRRDYAAIGSVTNLAARLCAEAKPGQTLTNQKTYARIDGIFDAEAVGELTLKGFNAPVNAFNVLKAKH
jgi:class 3 adenylate cyclase